MYRDAKLVPVLRFRVASSVQAKPYVSCLFRVEELIRQHSVPVSEFDANAECAKRWSRPRRDWEEASLKLEAPRTSPCVPLNEERPSFDWEDSNLDCEYVF